MGEGKKLTMQAVADRKDWLPFKGDPRDKPLDEHGVVIRKKLYVDQQYDEGIALLGKGRAASSSRLARTAGAH